MPGSNNDFRFAFDFFFTDIMNHVEFLKWTMTLGKDDDVLLIAILERLRCADQPRTKIEPFYASIYDKNHKDLPKNPLHVAVAYSQLKSLRAHRYNIFETAFLDRQRGSMYVALLAFAIEIMFFAILLVYNTWKAIQIVSTSNDSFIPVFLVMAISTTLFSFMVKRHYVDSQDFNLVAQKVMSLRQRQSLILMNQWCNQYLAAAILLFNVYFVLVSLTPSDAILNCVALAFIMDIDDTLAPFWDEDRVEDELALNVHGYILEPFGLADGKDENPITVQRLSKHEGIPYRSSDKCYVLLEGEEACPDNDLSGTNDQSPAESNEAPNDIPDDAAETFYVTVYRSSQPEEYDTNTIGVGLTTAYESIRYRIAGNRATEFKAAVGQFSCLWNLKDIHR